MALPGRKQTFALESCRDVHLKLEWEIQELKACPAGDGPEPMIYHAFNCAVTAWTLTDWVWLDMNQMQRACWGADAKGNVTSSAFQSYCREQSRALHLCRQIATASKHGETTKHLDSAVDASVGIVVAKAQPGAPAHAADVWKLTVHDGEASRDAVEVFEDALFFWDHFIVANNIPKDLYV